MLVKGVPGHQDDVFTILYSELCGVKMIYVYTLFICLKETYNDFNVENISVHN